MLASIGNSMSVMITCDGTKGPYFPIFEVSWQINTLQDTHAIDEPLEFRHGKMSCASSGRIDASIPAKSAAERI